MELDLELVNLYKSNKSKAYERLDNTTKHIQEVNDIILDKIETIDWAKLCKDSASEGYHGLLIVCPPIPTQYSYLIRQKLIKLFPGYIGGLPNDLQKVKNIRIEMLTEPGLIWASEEDALELGERGKYGNFLKYCYQKPYNLYELCDIDQPVW